MTKVKSVNSNDIVVRSSSEEFLVFSVQQSGDSVNVKYEDETLWITQKMMGVLFDVESNTITYHLKEIFESEELDRNSTTRKIRVVQKEGNRNVGREVEHYNLEVIISVGYRENAVRETQLNYKRLYREYKTEIVSSEL